MDKRSKHYLERYLSALNPEIANTYTSYSADYFCADEDNANVCADLILRGEKRASCSLEHWYSQEGETMPVSGHLQVVTNWSGEPVCIIEITEVELCEYRFVTAEFAAEEGEGDKTLEWWQGAHWTFFSQECQQLGIKPTQEMLLVLERFNVVFRG
ncbi:ASCH domain-containing protein [Vibrio ostreicida]|uniref:ASCH domain-containing protein n=1 Tax=Vibrio ostreicida TaxID=526588 RepID=A0ABT8C1G1_9VIBR|nr:ASCH domain-containing protein [Vibrio ostreicida]MDN3612454.1 ASCH domain-containing protein [Vibrio ostreicida]NPD10165.1 ASCH domain-containing protein [Vibrio ostreicida]